jgi:ATP-dependent Lon protease
MRESIQAADTYVKARAAQLGIPAEVLRSRDVHVHVPEGAVPKDGPSAGVAMVTAIVSSLTGIAVRREVAMTGEMTLRGRVLPIGGLKEKLLAALRGGLETVLIPRDNAGDLAEIPEGVRRGLEIVPVATVDEVLRHALVRAPEPRPAAADDEAAPSDPTPTPRERTGVVTH